MFSDVVDLRDFYATPLGRLAQRYIYRKIRTVWPDLTGERILGLGYATPYLRSLPEAERTIAAMSARRGVLHWPRKSPNRTALVDNADLPFPDLFFDRIIMVHSLEHSNQANNLLREVWRVLQTNGRLLIVIPNRRGLWARFDHTPLGHGTPYTYSQVAALLRDNMFTPTQGEHALFVPPSRSRVILSTSRAWERIGNQFFPLFSGITLIESTKQLYAGTPVGTEEAVKKHRATTALSRETSGLAKRDEK